MKINNKLKYKFDNRVYHRDFISARTAILTPSLLFLKLNPAYSPNHIKRYFHPAYVAVSLTKLKITQPQTKYVFDIWVERATQTLSRGPKQIARSQGTPWMKESTKASDDNNAVFAYFSGVSRARFHTSADSKIVFVKDTSVTRYSFLLYKIAPYHCEALCSNFWRTLSS